MGRGGASCPPAASASAVVAPPPRHNVPPNLHPGNGNTVAYGLWLNCVTARIHSLDNNMGGNGKDFNDKDNNDTRDGDCDDSREGRRR